MADSHVIARKFRPQTFAEVVGQDAITRTLVNAIESKRLHHAYLLAGARGVGKTTTARILAKAVNCEGGITSTPCGQCRSCVDIANSSSLDVKEIDAASNTGVENVRETIIASLAVEPSSRDRYKVFIIDEVHQLSAPAFNALLKTIEEPPPRRLFILATTEMHKVPETILSRCQVFEFRTISARKIFDQLKRIAADLGVEVSDSALLNIARAGEGSMRDAESAFDQVLSFAGKKIADEDISAALGLVGFETLNTIARSIADQDSGALLRIVDSAVSRGYDLRNLCRQLMTHLRALLVVKIAGLDQELLEVSPAEAQSLSELAETFSEQDLIRFFSLLTKTEQDLKLSAQPRFQMEIGLIKLAQTRRLYLLEDALSQIRELTGDALPIASAARPSARPAPVSTPPAKPFAPRPAPAASSPPARSEQEPPRVDLPTRRAQAVQSAIQKSELDPPPEPPPDDDHDDGGAMTNPAEIRKIWGGTQKVSSPSKGNLVKPAPSRAEKAINPIADETDEAEISDEDVPAIRPEDHPAVKALMDSFPGSRVEIKKRQDN